MKILTSAFMCASLMLGCGSASLAQQEGQVGPIPVRLDSGVVYDPPVTAVNSTPAPPYATDSALSATDHSDPSASGTTRGGTSSSSQWQLSVSPYLWFPWIHGTVGALGRQVGFSVTPSQLLDHARFGLLGTAEIRRKRILAPIDLLYLRLGADKGIPFPPALLATSANLTGNIFILTPKVGFRVFDGKALKADFLTGIRYWYFGESVNFSPSLLGLNFSRSQNWVDPLVGGRVEGALSPKIATTIAGDVGGWGAASQIEYQVVGLLAYKLKPNMTLQGGYRYLYFDYRRGGPADASANLALSGIVFGVTWTPAAK
ncbi:MAG: hypothetical protein WB608_00290 [Terracidiphilus sp.]